jgi:AcrR family transcriptional regulator
LFEDKAILDLADIAARSGVTTQTMLRRFGDKDAVFAAMFAKFATDIVQRRGRARANALDDIVANMVENYELAGRLTLKMLAESGLDHVPRRAMSIWAQQDDPSKIGSRRGTTCGIRTASPAHTLTAGSPWRRELAELARRLADRRRFHDAELGAHRHREIVARYRAGQRCVGVVTMLSTANTQRRLRFDRPHHRGTT